MKNIKKLNLFGCATLFTVALVTGYQLQAGESQSPDEEAATASATMTVYKSASCGCCAGWVEHLKQNGFDVEVRNTNNLNAVKAKFNVPGAMASCHTGVMNGQVFEGHVPASDIRRFIGGEYHAFGQQTHGIAVPGMPHGAPGMETGRQDAYEVVAFSENGRSQAVNRY